MPALRRVAGARLSERADVEDVVQETLTRLLEVRWRLDRSALTAYGVVTARNLVTSRLRERERDDRDRHRLIPDQASDGPDAELLQQEEHRAVAAALTRLSTDDADLLRAHAVEDRSLDKLAADSGSSPPAVAARLARVRGRARLEFLLAFRGAELPTSRCRPVLLALATADRRRQRDLRADNHLLACPTCSSLSVALLRRRRGLAGLLPLAAAGSAVKWAREHPAPTAGGAAATAAAVAVVTVATGGADKAPPPRAPAPAPRGPVMAGATVLLPHPPALTPLVGRRVVASLVPVQSVPADEGFWVGYSERDRLFVALHTRAESDQRVRRGMTVTFSGTLVRNPVRYAQAAGVSPAEGAALLRAQGVHIAVWDGSVRLSR